MTMTTTSIEADAPGQSLTLAEARSRVEQALASYLPPVDDPDAPCPPRLAEAIRYSLLGGGKRLRPVLALLAAEACGAEPDLALPAACALEMIHTYSLIHDDLPCMDDDDLRRGRATCHKVFGEATALLAGDSLQALAFEVVARDIRPASAAAACVLTLAEAAGPAGMAGGQMADLDAEGRTDATLAKLEAIHRRKTGALLRASLRMGGLVAGASTKQLDALDVYGQAVGLAFQIVDDLLDVQGDEGKMGKRVRKDQGLGKWTYPSLLGLDGSRQHARELAEEAVAALAGFGERGHRLRALALDLLERDR